MDFAGLQALSGIDNWAERRQARAQDMQYVSIMNAMAEKKQAQQQEQAQQVQDKLNTIGQIKVLEQDKGRIAEQAKSVEEKIKEGIKKSHGNLDEYLNTGGKMEVNKYVNELHNSKETNQALLNSLMDNWYQSDVRQGLTPRPVKVGDKVMSYDEQKALFNEGKIHELNYGGGYENPVGDPAKEFGARFGNPEGKPQTANARDVYDYWLNAPKGKGMTEHDRMRFASQKATEYQNKFGADNEKGGYPYKSRSPQELDYSRRNAIREQLATAKFKETMAKDDLRVLGANPYATLYENPTFGQQVKITPNAHAYADVFGQQANATAAPEATTEAMSVDIPHGEKSKASGAKLLGDLTYQKPAKDKETGWTGMLTDGIVRDPHTLEKSLMNLNDIKGWTIKDIKGIRKIISPDGKVAPFQVATIKFKNQSQMEDLGAINHHYMFPSSEKGAWQGDVDWDKNEVQVLIPVPLNPMGIMQHNTELKKYTNLQQESEYDPFYRESQDEE